MSLEKKIAYIYSHELRKQCDRLPTMINRASIVHDLISSFGIMAHPKLVTVKSLNATEDELKLFHSSDFVAFMKKANDCEDLDGLDTEAEEFGLGYDCPILPKHYDFVATLAGGSLSGAKLLAGGHFKIAINWFGGWHHAQRDSAEGFCYVNDIVLAIQKLSEAFNKILYVDLDIHHGDGVQNAFEYSKKILTLSFHKLVPGFYPGTGTLQEIGSYNGKYHTFNVPYLEGISHSSYMKLFSHIFPKIFNSFKPDCLVIQSGADSLHGDNLGQGNLTLKTLGSCIETILECDKPTLFCGGGGYNFANTARLWCYLTSIIVGQKLDDDIPDESSFFTLYGPTYELHIDSGNQKDQNSKEYIDSVITTIDKYCEYLI